MRSSTPARTGTIDVTLDRSNGTAVITVRDNGPGVPEDALPLLFKPFYRVDDSRGTTTGGMGLGLAIVRNAVAVHGGTRGGAQRLAARTRSGDAIADCADSARTPQQRRGEAGAGVGEAAVRCSLFAFRQRADAVPQTLT